MSSLVVHAARCSAKPARPLACQPTSRWLQTNDPKRSLRFYAMTAQPTEQPITLATSKR